MAIPKKYRKQVKAALKGSATSKASNAAAKSKPLGRKITWAFHIGDLVEHDDTCCFILDDSRGDGWFELMTPSGRKWVKAREIIKLQNLPAEAKAHANGKPPKV